MEEVIQRPFIWSHIIFIILTKCHLIYVNDNRIVNLEDWIKNINPKSHSIMIKALFIDRLFNNYMQLNSSTFTFKLFNLQHLDLGTNCLELFSSECCKWSFSSSITTRHSPKQLFCYDSQFISESSWFKTAAGGNLWPAAKLKVYFLFTPWKTLNGCLLSFSFMHHPSRFITFTISPLVASSVLNVMTNVSPTK